MYCLINMDFKRKQELWKMLTLIDYEYTSESLEVPTVYVSNAK